MEILSKFLKESENKRLKIAVVGDSLIDEYYSVRVNRISPEFPIPVLFSERDEPVSAVPGGAANVCHQMKYWNASVQLVSVISPESAEILCREHYGTRWKTTMSGWQNPRKKRFYDGDFPLDRWDIEKRDLDTDAWRGARRDLVKKFLTMIEEYEPDVVVLSDYGKGIFLENTSSLMISKCNEKGIPTVVDPKTVDKRFWKGCTTIKPNAGWSKAFCDKYADGVTWDASHLAEQLDTQEVVVTDSGNGLEIWEKGCKQFFSSQEMSKRRPIIRSVIGAGDCFCAFFVMAKALGFSLRDSAHVAFNGASAYIEDKHNSPVTPYTFHKWFDPVGAKRVNLDKLKEIKEQNPGKKWVWTNGCFDIVHAGHLKTLEEARKLGDRVIVGLNTDESVKSLKGSGRPVNGYANREILMSNLQNVDFVVPISEDTPENMIRELVPDKIVKGGDYAVRDVAGWDVVGEGNVHIIPLEPGLSTSGIIERIRDE